MRRYGPLGYLGSAVLVAVLLPSSLTLPQAGPPTAAEFAPVPGRSQAAMSPLGPVGQATSEGVGSGTAGAQGTGQGSPVPAVTTTTAAAPVSGPSGLRKAGTKRCVGQPPRQTEDPLSPPCIAYFSGDNGGATWRGVTDAEVRVAIIVNCTNSGETQITDLDDPVAAGTVQAGPQLAGYLRHFSDRFQLYGRRAHGYAVLEPCGGSRKAVIEVDERVQPFVIATFALQAEPVADEAARRQIMAIIPSGDRGFIHARAPYVLSPAPDVQDWADSAGAMVCAKLAGRPARLSGELAARTTVRKFALYYSSPADDRGVGKQLLLDAIARRCAAQAGTVEVNSGGTQQAAAQDVARWRASGVTTVIVVTSVFNPMTSAESLGWHPEWVVSLSVCCNGALAPPLAPPAQAANAIGWWHFRRLALEPTAQEWRAANREGCPSCASLGPSVLYDTLLPLFWGLQAAGPKLNPQNVDRGLHATPARQSPDPFTPAAYFAPADNHSWIKDHVIGRYDPTSSPPGQSTPGCWRLIEEGRRYRADDWAARPGDEDLLASGWPCQGSVG
jgi:hypothetical protein